MQSNRVNTTSEESRYVELQQLTTGFAREGETEALEKMLAAGMPVNLADAKGNTLLMLACYHGHFATARLLLERGADPDRRNDRKQTPLGGVAFKGYSDILELLLDHGADIDADNGGGMTAIMYAAMFGRAGIVTQLELRGATLKGRSKFWILGRLMLRVSRFVKYLKSLFEPQTSGVAV